MLDRRTFLGMLGVIAVNPSIAISSEKAAVIARLSKLKRGDFEKFDVWTWYDQQGRKMIQYGIQTATDRVVCRKEIGNETELSADEWIIRHEPTDPSRHTGSLDDDPFFDPYV